MDESELLRRIDRLEEQVQGIEQRWADEERRSRRKRQRERWMTLGTMILVAVAYLIYVQYVINIGS